MSLVINEMEVTPEPAATPANTGASAPAPPEKSRVQHATELSRSLARHRARAERVRAH